MKRTPVSTVALQHKSDSSVLRYATPLPMNRTPVSTVALQHKSVSFVLWYATPLPMNRTPVSIIAGRTEGRFLRTAVRQTPFRLFRPSWLAPVEQDAFRPNLLPPDEQDAVSSFRPSRLAAR